MKNDLRGILAAIALGAAAPAAAEPELAFHSFIGGSNAIATTTANASTFGDATFGVLSPNPIAPPVVYRGFAQQNDGAFAPADSIFISSFHIRSEGDYAAGAEASVTASGLIAEGFGTPTPMTPFGVFAEARATADFRDGTLRVAAGGVTNLVETDVARGGITAFTTASAFASEDIALIFPKSFVGSLFTFTLTIDGFGTSNVTSGDMLAQLGVFSNSAFYHETRTYPGRPGFVDDSLSFTFPYSNPAACANFRIEDEPLCLLQFSVFGSFNLGVVMDGIMDYSNTGQFSIDLAEGVRMFSASGVFLTADGPSGSVPEPGSLGLVLVAMLGLWSALFHHGRTLQLGAGLVQAHSATST